MYINIKYIPYIYIDIHVYIYMYIILYKETQICYLLHLIKHLVHPREIYNETNLGINQQKQQKRLE